MNVNLDPERAAELLTEATVSVFAEMAFLDAVTIRGGEAVPRDGEGTKCAVIDVMAPLSCRLELRVPAELRDRMVDILFSETPEGQRRKHAEDALLEMLNIITGNFLASYFGAATELQLSLPRYLYFDEELPGTAVADLRLDAEGAPFSVSLQSVRYRY